MVELPQIVAPAGVSQNLAAPVPAAAAPTATATRTRVPPQLTRVIVIGDSIALAPGGWTENLPRQWRVGA